MGERISRVVLAEEIEQLRRQLGEEWRQNHLLSNQKIVQLSQMLDVKISQFQRLAKNRL